LKNRLKKYVPATVQGFVSNTKLWNVLAARNLALRGKRIDVCAAQVAHNLHLAEISSLAGKTCLEIGAGWLLSHAIIYHLLGAKKVIATDVAPLAQLQFLHLAIQKPLASTTRDILSPFANHAEIRQRLDKLRRLKRFTYKTLKDLGIEYIAPVDLVQQPIQLEVDFIYSNSVLEHIPLKDIPLLVTNLGIMLCDGGIMLHSIHLEDHHDFKNDPFAFLEIPDGQFSTKLQQSRGNRVRASQWIKYFSRSELGKPIVLYQWYREDCPLPGQLCHSVTYKDDADIRCSHLGLYIQKKGKVDTI
jgi:Methyltransferase domain